MTRQHHSRVAPARLVAKAWLVSCVRSTALLGWVGAPLQMSWMALALRLWQHRTAAVTHRHRSLCCSPSGRWDTVWRIPPRAAEQPRPAERAQVVAGRQTVWHGPLSIAWHSLRTQASSPLAGSPDSCHHPGSTPCRPDSREWKRSGRLAAVKADASSSSCRRRQPERGSCQRTQPMTVRTVSGGTGRWGFSEGVSGGRVGKKVRVCQSASRSALAASGASLT